MGPRAMTGVLIKRGQDTDAHRRDSVNTQGNKGHPQAKERGLKRNQPWDAWGAQPMKRLPSAQAVIPGSGIKSCVGLLAQWGTCFAFCLLCQLPPSQGYFVSSSKLRHQSSHLSPHKGSVPVLASRAHTGRSCPAKHMS